MLGSMKDLVGLLNQTCRPLLGSSYINLPIKLRNPRKGLTSIKNKDQKCFLWFHVRHIIPSKEHPGRI